MKMRNLFSKRNVLTAIVASASLYSSSLAVEKAQMKPANQISPKAKYIAPYEKPVNVTSKVRGANATADIQLVKIDSLANALSFYTNGTQPFVYDKYNHQYVYVQRGYGESDTKNDIFLRVSDDGSMWNAPITIFDHTARGLQGRYPSVATIGYADNFYAIVSCPTLNGDAGFNGMATTTFNLKTNKAVGYNFNSAITSNEYQWSTDSKILAQRTNDGKNIGVVIGRVSPNPGVEGEMSGCGMVRTEDLTTFASSMAIPSSIFMSGTELGVYSDLIGTVEANGKFYAAIQGRFAAETNYTLPGFAVSDNGGISWGEYQLPPKSIFNDFISGAMPDEYVEDGFSLAYDSKGFTVLDNGDVYFVGRLNGTLASDPNYIHGFMVEIYKESGNWGVRKIADAVDSNGRNSLYQDWYPTDENGIFPYWKLDADKVPVVDENGWKTPIAASTDYETQLSRSVDGKYLLAKYLLPAKPFKAYTPDYVDFQDSLFLNQATVMVASRKIGEDYWKLAYLTPNLGIVLNEDGTGYYDISTKSFNRVCHLPNIVPNDLANVPFLLLKSIVKETSTTLVDSLVDMSNMNLPQYVYAGLFNFNDLDQINSVNNDNQAIANIEVKSLSPNPVYNNEANLNLFINNSARVKVEVYDILGNRLFTAFDDICGNGLFSLPLDTKNISNGIYNIVVTSNGFKVSKQLSIAR